jgi:hypothetical protein
MQGDIYGTTISTQSTGQNFDKLPAASMRNGHFGPENGTLRDGVETGAADIGNG